MLPSKAEISERDAAEERASGSAADVCTAEPLLVFSCRVVFVIILSSFLVVNAATDARFLFLCCCVGDGFIIVVVVLDRLFSFVLLLVLHRVEVAKAIGEEDRNIGVAFIPPLTLTCVCVCVFVFMSAPPSI